LDFSPGKRKETKKKKKDEKNLNNMTKTTSVCPQNEMMVETKYIKPQISAAMMYARLNIL